MTEPARFAEDARAALENVPMFEQTYQALLALAREEWGVTESELTGYLRGTA